MCNGSLDLGSKTAFGSGKIGIRDGRADLLGTLMRYLRLLVHIVHQDVLAE